MITKSRACTVRKFFSKSIFINACNLCAILCFRPRFIRFCFRTKHHIDGYINVDMADTSARSPFTGSDSDDVIDQFIRKKWCNVGGSRVWLRQFQDGRTQKGFDYGDSVTFRVFIAVCIFGLGSFGDFYKGGCRRSMGD